MATITTSCRLRGGMEVPKNIRLGENTITFTSNAKSNQFETDFLFQKDANNQCVFKAVEPLISTTVDEGGNLIILAYGQSGSGKTHTIVGPDNGNSLKNGIAPSTFSHLFTFPNLYMKMKIFQILENDIFDLIKFTDRKIVRADITNGIETREVRSAFEACSLFDLAMKYRTTRSTKLNEQSSRSHLVVELQYDFPNLTAEKVVRQTSGKIIIIDLAGSEKYEKSSRKKEVKSINQSLMYLSKMIRDMTSSNGGFVVTRNCNLTKMLGGVIRSSRIFICVNINPIFVHESQKSLEFLNNCKKLKKEIELKKNVKRVSASVDFEKIIKGEKDRVEEEKRIEMEKLRTNLQMQYQHEIERYKKKIREKELEREKEMKKLEEESKKKIERALEEKEKEAKRFQREWEFQKNVEFEALCSHYEMELNGVSVQLEMEKMEKEQMQKEILDTEQLREADREEFLNDAREKDMQIREKEEQLFDKSMTVQSFAKRELKKEEVIRKKELENQALKLELENLEKTLLEMCEKDTQNNIDNLELRKRISNIEEEIHNKERRFTLDIECIEKEKSGRESEIERLKQEIIGEGERKKEELKEITSNLVKMKQKLVEEVKRREEARNEKLALEKQMVILQSELEIVNRGIERERREMKEAFNELNVSLQNAGAAVEKVQQQVQLNQSMKRRRESLNLSFKRRKLFDTSVEFIRGDEVASPPEPTPMREPSEKKRSKLFDLSSHERAPRVFASPEPAPSIAIIPKKRKELSRFFESQEEKLDLSNGLSMLENFVDLTLKLEEDSIEDLDAEDDDGLVLPDEMTILKRKKKMMSLGSMDTEVAWGIHRGQQAKILQNMDVIDLDNLDDRLLM